MDFSDFKKKLSDTTDWLKKELAAIRTGEASPAILDGVTVESYGSNVPLNQVGNISREDARTIRVDVWNDDDVSKVEKAIVDADLGVSVSVGDGGVRVSFPALTEETRERFLKDAKSKLEEARVTVRQERDEIWNTIQKQQKQGEITEDEMYRFKEEMEKIVSDSNDELEALFENKKKQIKQ